MRVRRRRGRQNRRLAAGSSRVMASSPGESARQSARISIAAIVVPVVLTPRVISVGMTFNAEAGCEDGPLRRPGNDVVQAANRWVPMGFADATEFDTERYRRVSKPVN